MSNKITLATIQFRADAHGVTPALDAMRQSSKDAHEEVDKLQEALDRGIKTIKDANGIDINVAKRLNEAKKEAKDFDAAIRELMKGATALESVVKNIELGTIEKNSRAELKGAINAASSRLRSIREMTESGVVDEESLQRQRELNIVILESQKQLNNLDRDTKKVIETIEQGGTISEAVLSKEMKGLKDMLTIIPKGTEEWNKYNAQLQTIETHVAAIRKQEREAASTLLSSKSVGQYSQYSEEEIRMAITNGKELLSTYKTNSNEAKILAENIARAEEYLRQYGLEAARQAQRETAALNEAIRKRQEADQLMQQQLMMGISISQSALRQQEQYWQRLIDDPKTAAESLDHYRKNLDIVQRTIQDRAKIKIETEGLEALEFFQRGTGNASVNTIKQQADALKKWRDSLPQQEHADKIREIDGYLAKAGKTAESAKKEMMGLAEAMSMASNSGKSAFGMTERDEHKLEWLRHHKKLLEEWMSYSTEGSDLWKDNKKSLNEVNDELRRLPFSGTTEDLKKAQQALEAAISTTEKGTPKYDRLRMALARVKAELSGAGITAQKTQEVLANPKAAKNVETLKQAIARARAEMDVMGQRMERMQRLLEEAEKNGNTRWANRLRDSIKQTSRQIDQMAESTKRADQAQKELANTSKGAASAFEKAWSRLKTYVGLYMGFNIVWQKVAGTATDLMQLSDKMGEVRKTTGFTADEVGRLSDNLKRLDVRTPLTQLMEIAAKAGQLGLKSEQDVMGFTEAANKLMIALPEMGAEAATEMMKVAIATGEVKKIQDQLNKGLVEGSSATEVALSKVGSVIDQLRANSAAAAPQITDFVKRVGAVGAQSGITIDQVAALGATVDAIGLRVEMSATALSRMIPAIKNNAFEVAKAIGMAPEALREMFEEAGGGMEALLAIFQHIKDSGMDEDSIEKMLGIGNMQDVMKQLNQQGARAGIVFAGLSQNVDELRRNLNVATEAYEDNIAILQEYNKMNDTTAAKWERFKNLLEEFFVGDASQRFLGELISRLRGVTEILIGNNGWSAALRTVGVYLLAIKLNIAGIFSGVKNISVTLRGIAMAIGLIDKETKKWAWGNIFTALAMAALWAARELVNLKSALDKASESLGKTKDEISRSIDRFEGYWAKLKSTSEALLQAKASHEKLSAEVDKLRNATDGSAESTANLKKKEDELTTSEKNVTKASNDHKSAIAQMNSIYGKYLGFILTESNYSNLAAAAHDKVTAAIEREMLMKQRQAAIGEVDSNYSDNIATGYGDLNERLVQYGKLSRSEAAKAMSDMQRFMRENLKYDAGTNATVVSKAITDQLKKSGLDISKADANEIAALWFDQYLEENYHLSDKVRQGLTGVSRRSDLKEGWGSVSTPFATNLRGGYAETYAQREQARGAVSAVYDVDISEAESREAEASGQLLANLEKAAQNAKKVILDKDVDETKRNYAYVELANALEGLDNRINELDPQKDAATINRLNEMAESLKGEGIDIEKLKQAREKINQTLFERATFNAEDVRNLDTTNPWGGSHDAASTDWKNMNAEQLVARRKQMKEFVNSIQTDTDVQSVLKEDAALKKAIENGMSSDMRTVIEWYNTERLKIQDELHARYLTNTGDWMDPKKQKAAYRRFQDEMRMYLEELDAYYTERNQEIQTARNNEEITEAEAWRRTIKNETEWYNRRAELQKLYGEKDAEVTKEEQDAIFAIIAERTGDSTQFIQQMIGKTIQFAKEIENMDEKGAAMVHKWRSDLGLGWEKDFLKSAKSTGKQMKFIEDTLAKERPFDGITKNLQENLDKMGVLAAQYKRINDELAAQGKPKKYSDAEITAATYDEMAFFLKQAENAWSIDIDELLRRMAQEGMAATAEEIGKSELLKQAVMGQLRKTFEEVQNAVKKEASQIKKDVDILWNDDMRGPNGMSMKSAYDQAIARLGMQQDSVSRANSLIGAGAASDNVSARLAMKQIEMQMRMQKAQYDTYRVQANQRIMDLKKEAAEHKRIADQAEREGRAEEAAKERLQQTIALRDAENVRKSLGLTLAEETKKEEENIANLLKLQEESQHRLYTSLKEWGNLLAGSMQSVFEASHAGDAEYYNELAKLNLTGKGGPGAGTYIVIDNEGTEDAQAHYEYLDDLQALERQREIENQNAQADAWKKVMDDINMKMSEQITDMLNASLQNAATEANTDATLQNTQAIIGLTGAMAGGSAGMGIGKDGVPESIRRPDESTGEGAMYKAPWQMTDDDIASGQENMNTMWQSYAESGTAAMQQMGDVLAEQPAGVTPPWAITEEQIEPGIERMQMTWAAYAEASTNATEKVLDNQRKVQQGEQQTDKKVASSASSAFSKMAAACNMYGLAYQTVTNDNLDASQKFQMFALQAAGQTAIGMLTTDLFLQQGKAKVELPGILGKAASQLGPIAGPIAFAAMTALLGGLMGLAVSQVAKSKSQISQVTGASVGAGRLSTGMLTYAEGNVNEFTDPSTLTPGRSYNVDAADGRTYRAKYTGSNPRTHITNGPEFHLVGEAGREAIIDAKTTRNIQLNEPGIWRSIQTLYNGGMPAMRHSTRMGRGVRAYADGNLDDFEDMADTTMDGGMSIEMVTSLQQSIDRQSDLLERALAEGIKGVFNVHGPHGLVRTYDQAKKEAQRHGMEYT